MQKRQSADTNVLIGRCRLSAKRPIIGQCRLSADYRYICKRYCRRPLPTEENNPQKNWQISPAVPDFTSGCWLTMVCSCSFKLQPADVSSQTRSSKFTQNGYQNMLSVPTILRYNHAKLLQQLITVYRDNAVVINMAMIFTVCTCGDY